MNNVLLIKNKILRSWCIERFWGGKGEAKIEIFEKLVHRENFGGKGEAKIERLRSFCMKKMRKNEQNMC